MNQEIKAKWVAALRSGEYIQGKGNLKTNGRHCCLGVLCEISKEEIGIGVSENIAQTHGDQNLGFTVLCWAGMHLDGAEGPEVTIREETGSLVFHNDNGRTFLEIADAIEGQL